MTATIYLLPSVMSDTPPSAVLPAGNIEIVRRLKYFIVENVRTARRFLKACDREIDIDGLTFFELNRHTAPEELAGMLAPAEAGNDIGIISEAGCPAIADPGADIVALAQRRGITVRPLVGPSSIILSLMASGFNGQSFAFLGYLPIESDRRSAAMRAMERRVRNEHQTQIFIETPYRNNRVIAELAKVLPGAMLLCVASDITGGNERIITKPLSWWGKASYNYDKIPTIFLLYE